MKATYSKIRFSLYKAYTNLERLLYKEHIKHLFTAVFIRCFYLEKKGVTTAVITVFIILNNQFISILNAFIAYQMSIYTNID